MIQWQKEMYLYDFVFMSRWMLCYYYLKNGFRSTMKFRPSVYVMVHRFFLEVFHCACLFALLPTIKKHEVIIRWIKMQYFTVFKTKKKLWMQIVNPSIQSLFFLFLYFFSPFWWREGLCELPIFSENVECLWKLFFSLQTIFSNISQWNETIYILSPL